MGTTTLAAAVLSGLLVSGASNVLPSWHADYAKAMEAAVAQQKPMAVFIGKGEAGHTGLVTEGQIPAPANQLLVDKFVCVYVNTDTPTGKDLAGKFGLNQGLVISSRGGNVQALRHTGPVTQTDLTGYLNQYGTESTTVVSTAQGGTVSTSAYTPLSTAAPFTAVAPAAPVAAPAVGGYGYPAMSYPTFGGCPGGNCGGVTPYYGGYRGASYGGASFGGGCPGGRCR